MADPFIGEIRLFPFNFAPRNWAICQGQLLPISQNAALFSILGVQYGGNGTNNFALPNLQGIVPIGQGQGPGLSAYSIGQTGGAPSVGLVSNQMPGHSHPLNALAATAAVETPVAGSRISEGHGGGRGGGFQVNSYSTSAPGTTLSFATAGQTGGNAPHNNMQPYLALTWCIALAGIFPARN